MAVGTWKSVALPVLNYIGIETLGPGDVERIAVSKISASIGQSPEAIIPELSLLIDGGYISGRIKQARRPEDVQILRPRLTEKGARTVKRWPDERSRFSRFFDSPLKVSSAIVALLAAVISLAFAIYPQLKPKEKLGASITAVEVEQQVSFREYKLRTSADREELARFQGVQDPWLGDLVVVRVSLNGYKDRDYAIAPRIVDAKTNKRLRLNAMNNQPTLFGIGPLISPSANEDNVVFRSWSLSPPKGIEYYLRVEIYDVSELPIAPGGGKIFDESRARPLDVKSSKNLVSRVDPGWR